MNYEIGDTVEVQCLLDVMEAEIVETYSPTISGEYPFDIVPMADASPIYKVMGTGREHVRRFLVTEDKILRLLFSPDKRNRYCYRK